LKFGIVEKSKQNINNRYCTDLSVDKLNVTSLIWQLSKINERWRPRWIEHFLTKSRNITFKNFASSLLSRVYTTLLQTLSLYVWQSLRWVTLSSHIHAVNLYPAFKGIIWFRFVSF